MTGASDHELPERSRASEEEAYELERRLADERPVPRPGFRGGLGRMVGAHDPGWGPRPVRLRLVVAGWVAAGLLVAGLGVLDALGSV